jgi:hypothetical protein
MMQNQPRDQMGEIGDEKQIVNKIIFLRLFAVDIDQKGDLGESEE